MTYKLIGAVAAAALAAVAFGAGGVAGAPATSNFIVNGNFDSNIDGWTIASPYASYDPNVDKDNSAGSGSVSFNVTATTGYNSGVTQCLPAFPGMSVSTRAWVEIPTASQSPTAFADFTVRFLSNTDCAVPGYITQTTSNKWQATGWQQHVIDAVAPAGTNSMLIYAGIGQADASAVPAYGHIDAITVVASGDADGDGCLDGAEFGQNPALGGDRDPLDASDFFDVPVPALLPADESGARDGQVNLSDVLAVLSYTGTMVGGPANPYTTAEYDTDLNTNGLADGAEYDRTPSQDPAKPWQSGPPDGAVTLADVIVALEQTGHSCAG